MLLREYGFCAGLVFRDSWPGLSSYAVSILSTDKLFLRLRILAGMQLSRLRMLCRVSGLGLIRLSGLGSCGTHPGILPSSARSWSTTLPIRERQPWLLQDMCMTISYHPRRRIPAFVPLVLKLVCVCVTHLEQVSSMSHQTCMLQASCTKC